MGPHGLGMTQVSDLERTGRRLQTVTIIWNLIEVFITVTLGILAASLALVAFGLDSLIEVFASLVVLWHMNDTTSSHRDRRARNLVAAAFALLALYLTIAGSRALLTGTEPESSPIGIAYLAVTAVVMFTLAAWKARIGRRLDNEPFLAESKNDLPRWLARHRNPHRPGARRHRRLVVDRPDRSADRRRHRRPRSSRAPRDRHVAVEPVEARALGFLHRPGH